jgi:hypothetical protein
VPSSFRRSVLPRMVLRDCLNNGDADLMLECLKHAARSAAEIGRYRARLRECGAHAESNTNRQDRSDPSCALSRHEQILAGRGPFLYMSTSTLNPPYAIRFTSKGIGWSIVLAIRGSFITFALTRSRAARDL